MANKDMNEKSFEKYEKMVWNLREEFKGLWRKVSRGKGVFDLLFSDIRPVDERDWLV